MINKPCECSETSVLREKELPLYGHTCEYVKVRNAISDVVWREMRQSLPQEMNEPPAGYLTRLTSASLIRTQERVDAHYRAEKKVVKP
jgi:hypothetical protein